MNKRRQAIRELLHINGLIYLKSNQETTTLKRSDLTRTLRYKGSDARFSLLTILNQYKGNQPYLMSSDVFDQHDVEVKLESLEPHRINNLIVDILEMILPFLEKLSVEEGSAIIIQNFVSLNEKRLSITAGHIDDMQVAVMNITPFKE